MKTHNSIYATLIISIFLMSCTQDFLNLNPKGSIALENIQDAEGAELLVIAAYAGLGNGGEHSNISDWIYGSVRSDDTYKGGASTGDFPYMHRVETFTNLVDEVNIHNVWRWNYEWIARANLALKIVNQLGPEEYPQQLQRQAELRFLRAHFYFKLIPLFKNVPWIDEHTTEFNTVSNREYTLNQLYDKLAEDFQFAADVLPETQQEVGRPTKFAATAYLAKIKLYQAYEQDENHNVTAINASKLNEVVALTDAVITSGKYRLSGDFAENFIFEYENGPESIFAIQFSVDDGTPIGGRLNWGNNLNYHMAPQYGCCWFNIPSQNLVNSFKTNNDGLPLFETFDDTEMSAPEDFLTNGVDPRLGHTVGAPGHPFKYDPSFIYQTAYARAPEVYGYFSPMRETEHYSSPALRVDGSRRATARNQDVIRYADVILWKAEALIELGRYTETLPLINMLRTRAKNSLERIKLTDGTHAANYHINEYIDGVNISWTQETSRHALRWERRLEFATESPRFFDLVRWGITSEVLNEYLAHESQRRSYLRGVTFQKGRDEYLPIPQQEIDLSEGLYQQNPGY